VKFNHKWLLDALLFCKNALFMSLYSEAPTPSLLLEKENEAISQILLGIRISVKPVIHNSLQKSVNSQAEAIFGVFIFDPFTVTALRCEV
jgi:hypothetical protein